MKLHVNLIGVFLMIISVSFIPVAFGLEHSDLIKIKTNEANIFGDDVFSRPTFGSSHEDTKKIVDGGFRLNNQTFSIYDNYHTPFNEQSIVVGERSSFEATVFSYSGLQVQEFLFGIPRVGEGHLAEAAVEIRINFEGEIENVKTIQKSNVIDESTIVATHKKVKCKPSSFEERCDSTRISIMFLEPLKDKVIAIKAIDFKNRHQITYLNDGIDVNGESLNPPQTVIISPLAKNQEPLKLTQSKKYSNLWTAEDGKIFERNSFGSFKQIINSFERFQDSGEPLTRNHSSFDNILKYEQSRALKIFNSTVLISELPEIFAYSFPEPEERITEEIKQTMLEQEKIAQKIIKESNIQARFSDVKPQGLEN
jgi:hypothetical protein